MKDSNEFIDGILDQQNAAVTSIAVSPDERYLFSVSKDGKIYGYWIRSRAFCMSMGQSKALLSISISPDSKYLVTGTENNKVIYWKHSVVGHQRMLENHTAPVTSALFTPDSKFIFSGGKDKLINKWDIETNKLIKSVIFPFEINCLAITSNGINLFIGNGADITIYDCEDGAVVKVLKDHRKTLKDIAIDSADSFMVSVSADKTVKLWDFISLSGRNILNDIEDNFSAVAIYPDGRFIAVGTDNDGSDNNFIYIWQVSMAKCVKKIQAHKGSINSLVFSIDGKYLFSGSEDHTVISWDFDKLLENIRKDNEDRAWILSEDREKPAIEFTTKHPVKTEQLFITPKTEEIIIEETVLEDPEMIPLKFDEIRGFIKDGDTATALEEALYLQDIIDECKLKEYKEPIKLLLNMIKDLIKKNK